MSILRAYEEKQNFDRTVRRLLALLVRRAGGHAYFKWDQLDREPPTLRYWEDADGTIHVSTPMEGGGRELE